MPSRSQDHKQRVQGIRSDGSVYTGVPLTALVDQTSTNNVADTYTHAAFASPPGALTYSAESLVGGAPVPLIAGFSYNPATRQLSWTKATGTYVIRITARNLANEVAVDDFNIVVT